MIDIHSLWWEDEYGYDCCVCPACRSDQCSYYGEGEDGGWRCWTCGKDSDGQIQRDHPFDCPACGWAILKRYPDDRHPWHCTKCRADFAGDLDTGPTGDPVYPEYCPTCEARALYAHYGSNGPKPAYYRCAACETEFHATHTGSMIPPEHCGSCGHMAVQLFDYLQFPRGQRTVTEVKRCTVCKQFYRLEDLHPLDQHLVPIAQEEPDDKGEYVTVEIAEEHTPAEPKQE